MPDTTEIHRLLGEISKGNQDAMNQLLPLVYEELHRLARAQFRRERGDHTLQATALVHEAYLRLVDQRSPIESRSHFLALAATQMRRILLDYARKYLRRAGAGEKVLLEDTVAACGPRPVDMIALDKALDSLAALDPVQGKLVEMRFFGGLSLEETAEVLGIGTATVERRWRSARALLRAMLKGGARKGEHADTTALDAGPEHI